MLNAIRMAALALVLAAAAPALASPLDLSPAGLLLDTLGMNIVDSGPSGE